MIHTKNTRENTASFGKTHTPSIVVVFGATGDLAAKKIFPSFWYLYQHQRLPDKFAVIGFSRQMLSDTDFRSHAREAIIERDPKASETALDSFLESFFYQPGVFEDASAYQTLSDTIGDVERRWGVCANKLYFLAVPPSWYASIFKNLAAFKLNIPCGGNLGWSRILIEKPFGADLKSAGALETLVSSYFKDEQIYRIDHYLAKEIIQGIENFRFSNNLFENAWDNTMIERIDIRLVETIGAEGRGAFYESVGALRDVGQNHLLMMLAAITMEYPPGMAAQSVRKSRATILQTLRPWTEELIKSDTFRAQYRGYRDIEGVKKDSKTETYFALKTELLHPRFKNIPIFLEAGKLASPEAKKEIVLTLKHPPVCLLCEAGPHAPNRIVFRLEPNDEIIIQFWTKKPGFDRTLEQREFSFFLYEKENKVQYVEEYAKLFHAAMEGNQSVFVSHEEIKALWKFTDPIVSSWAKDSVPLADYAPNTAPHVAFLETGPDRIHVRGKDGIDSIGMIGLGKMGANLARRLSTKGWNVAGLDYSNETTASLASEGVVTGHTSLSSLVTSLRAPRTVWIMVPAGKPVDDVIFGTDGLATLLHKGDTIIDGGNSFYKDSVRRGKQLKKKGIHFLDVGVSGGPISIELGKFAIMAGGEPSVYAQKKPIFDALSDTPSGYMGKAGAGHFVKMVHNGIEYGMMQALAEGFSVLREAPFRFNLKNVAHVYNQNSIITSRLTGWLEEGFATYGNDLKKASGTVAHTGEGEWTVKTARELGVATPIIKGSYLFRIHSKKHPTFMGKVLSTLRAVFGGHSIT